MKEVGGGNTGCRDRQRPRGRLAELGDTSRRLREQRLRAQHVVGQERPRCRQLTAPGSALDLAQSQTLLDVRDVLGQSPSASKDCFP